MEVDAAVPTPATEEALPPVEVSEDDALSAAFDKLTVDGIEEESEPVAQPEPVVEPEPVEAPTDLPLALKEKWAAIPQEARDVIAEDRRKLSSKMAEQGRIIQGMAPVHQSLAQAAKEFPALANMRPEQVASEVMQLARISHDFNTKPVETLMGLAVKHGMVDRLREALNVPAQPNDASAKIAKLEQKLAQVTNPDYLRQNFAQITAEERAMGEVQSFAQSAEHWADVEAHLPRVIPIVQEKLGPGASAKDVLTKAYDMAVKMLDLQAPPQPAAPAPVVADPKKAEAAINAKSVNVARRPSGEFRALTEDEALSAAYDRASRN